MQIQDHSLFTDQIFTSLSQKEHFMQTKVLFKLNNLLIKMLSIGQSNMGSFYILKVTLA